MSKVALQGNISGTGTVTIAAPNTNVNRTLNLPDGDGTLAFVGSPSVSSTNTTTNKIPIVINGVTYYLLASTSGA